MSQAGSNPVSHTKLRNVMLCPVQLGINQVATGSEKGETLVLQQHYQRDCIMVIQGT